MSVFRLDWIHRPVVVPFLAKKVRKSLTVDCKLSDPTAEVSLYQKDTHYRRRYPDGCKVTYSRQVFTIHALVILDVGSYYCTAENVTDKEEVFLKVDPGMPIIPRKKIR